MIITDFARTLLAGRRERRRLLALGYHPHETDPEITRGRRRDEIIIDAIISADGKYVYTKIGKPAEAPDYMPLTGNSRHCAKVEQDRARSA